MRSEENVKLKREVNVLQVEIRRMDKALNERGGEALQQALLDVRVAENRVRG